MINVLLLKQHAPRWVVFIIDIFIVFFSIILAFFLRFNLSLPVDSIPNFIGIVLFVIGVRIVSFIISKTYAGIVRYTSTSDAIRIFLVILAGTVFIAISNIVSFYLVGNYIVPFSVLMIDFFINVFIMTTSRLLVKTLYFEFKNISREAINVAIYGVDEFALVTKRVLERDTETKYVVVAFIDDLSNNVGKKLDGINIYSYTELTKLIEKFLITNLVIATKFQNSNKKSEIIETCLNFDTKVLTVPAVNDWINGQLSFKQIRMVNIEDLLERDSIKLDEKQIKKEILNKVVLVTGGAGSIGGEMVKQLSRFYPKKIIIFDQAESPLYDLELEMREKYGFYDLEVVIGSATNPVRVNKVFEAFRPDVVYHAAAYKHVPMMENNPSEAVRTNVLGTKIIADLAVRYGVKKFVMISTDKAVNPTNVMGASKRIAEIYTQSLNKVSNTKFITTRFGNVLGSNGSVIPRFKSQIEKGGPVTVTHPDVTRYFMTIPEACQLVLEASAFGKGGEIFIFDMGKSVKIVDLAKKMIQLSGLTLGKDINLFFTGLRPGEKLYEELLNDKENTLPTHHPQIMTAKICEYNFEEVDKNIALLISVLKNHNNYEIVGLMKKIVPEFKSQNSTYEELDNEDILNKVLRNISTYIKDASILEKLINTEKNPEIELNGKKVPVMIQE